MNPTACIQMIAPRRLTNVARQDFKGSRQEDINPIKAVVLHSRSARTFDLTISLYFDGF